MKYRMNENAPFYHTGTILNCADGSNLNPNDFDIISYMEHIKTGYFHPKKVDVKVDGEQLTFTAHLKKGVYHWKTILHHKAYKNMAWEAPVVIIEVT